MPPDRNTVHSPRIDDEMAAETEALTRSAPAVDAIDDAGAGALSATEVRRRSELAAAIPTHAFPGDRGTLLHAAESEHAPTWVIDALGTLPIDTRFDTPQDVWSALGGHRESREEPEPEPAVAQDDIIASAPLPSPPPALDVVQRLAGIAGVGVGIASAVVGGTLQVFRRVLRPLQR